MNDNVITFPAPASMREGAYGEPAGLPAPVTQLFQTPAEGRFEAVTDSANASDTTLSPGEIWNALCNSRVRIHYQPQYNIATGEIAAAEALVCLLDSDGQLVYPDRFIELVEHSDLIVPLGRAVIEQVCADMASCLRQGVALQRVAINLSASQLNIDTQLADFIDEVVTRYGLPYSALEFELTERQKLLPGSAGMSALNTLARRGARLVLDDFGMGYSSVAYLTGAHLPISALKLDRDLVSSLPDNETIQHVVTNLLSMAADLKLEVVAEGVETQAQAMYLEQSGCLYAQGFGYARPMCMDDLRCFIANKRTMTQGDISA